MVRDGFRFFFLLHVRAQLAMEIRKQFGAFARTGLPLDHVNTHKHFHMHPTVLSLILKIGKAYGMRAMRLPCETDTPVWLKTWVAQMRARLDRANIVHNDYVVGIARTGQMDENTLLDVIARLAAGVGEIYCHPAWPGDGALTAGMRAYRHADELAALLSTRVAAALDAAGTVCGGFADLSAHRLQAA